MNHSVISKYNHATMSKKELYLDAIENKIMKIIQYNYKYKLKTSNHISHFKNTSPCSIDYPN